MQNSRTILVGLLCPLPGPLHVLHFLVQHFHEDLLHRLNSLYHLFNEIQEALLHSKNPTWYNILDIRLNWWWFPSFKSSIASSICIDFDHKQWMEHMGIRMELQSMARIYSFHPSNRDAKQNSFDWEHHISLCCSPGTLQILLHP